MILRKIIMVGIVLALIVLGVVFYGFSNRSRISVHDLDWGDYEEMNEHVSAMTFNIPPHFMDWVVETHLDLTDIFRLLSDNQHLLRDRAEVRGQTLDSDFEIVIEFTNLSGDEKFLNGRWSQDTLNINFYVDRSLAQESLDLTGEAEEVYQRAQNPDSFPEIIPLSEINWPDLMDDYESYIEEIFISRFTWRLHTEDFDFKASEDDLTDILRFFEANSDSFVDGDIDIGAIMDELFETGDIGDIEEYSVWIIFRLPDSEFNDEQARPQAMFHMSEELGEQLAEIIGEEALSRAQR